MAKNTKPHRICFRENSQSYPQRIQVDYIEKARGLCLCIYFSPKQNLPYNK